MRTSKYKSGALWLMPLVLWAGCATESLPDPSLYSVCLSAKEPCVSEAYAGERTNVALIGEHFNPAFEVDLNNDDPPPLRGNFRALIADTPIDDVRRHSDTLLVGILPGTVPLGSHRVDVEIPGGLEAWRQEAFSIVDPLSVTATPDHPRVPRGHTFGLDVTLQNLGTVLLTQVTLSLSQDGAGRILLPADSVLASLGGESSSTTTLQLQALEERLATLELNVSALAGGYVLVGTPEPVEIDILVLPPAALVVSTNVSPTEVGPGDRFELIVTVFNTGGVDASDVEVLEPDVSGSGSVALDDPAPIGVNIPAGSRQTLPWGGRAMSRGTAVFDVRVQGLEAISGRLLGPEAADPVSIEIR